MLSDNMMTNTHQSSSSLNHRGQDNNCFQHRRGCVIRFVMKLLQRRGCVGVMILAATTLSISSLLFGFKLFHQQNQMIEEEAILEAFMGVAAKNYTSNNTALMPQERAGESTILEFRHDASSPIEPVAVVIDSETEERHNLMEKYKYMFQQRKTFINASSVIVMGYYQRAVITSQFVENYFGSEIEMVPSWIKCCYNEESERKAAVRDFEKPAHGRGDVLYGGLCDTILMFKELNGTRKHILFSYLNENWGALSEPIPNRSVDWNGMKRHFWWTGCEVEDLWWYLNHTNVSAVFTTTHQWIDHPKVFSLPLGVKQKAAKRIGKEYALQERMTVHNRTELLLIALSSFRHRPSITQSVIANFNGTIQNRYKDGSDYWKNLRHAKYTLCPGGLGLDTYRAWEAIMMGSVPVLEIYNRKDGFYRVFDDLPVLWVDHFDNVTPSLLEESYPEILARAETYNFAKLTKSWWVDFINSFR